MELYLPSISLFTYALVTFFLLIVNTLPLTTLFKHFWPSLLLVVSRGLIMVLLIAFLSDATKSIINGLDVLATLCFVWLLLSFIPDLPPPWWIAARWGGGFALLPVFLAFISSPNSQIYVYSNLAIAAICLLFVIIGVRTMKWGFPLWAYLGAPLAIILANLSLLNIFGSSKPVWLFSLLAYALLITVIHQELIRIRIKNLQIAHSIATNAKSQTDSFAYVQHQKGDVLKERYEIKREISQGGFAVVYQAEDHNLKDVVAVKCFNYKMFSHFGSLSEMKDLFRQEALITHRLEHPHIISIRDFIEMEDTCYIIMPYIPNNLVTKLNVAGCLDIPAAIEIMRQICEGLTYAHNFRLNGTRPRTVVHCDIKPSNILFDKGQVKITDFGIAHIAFNSENTATISSPYIGVGTLFYMSPEQLEGKRDDPRIDVYALGALFYKVLTGSYYLDFDIRSKDQSNNRLLIWKEKPSDIPLRQKNTPQPIIDIILKALSKNPKVRFTDAGEMLEAIKAFKFDNDIPPTEPQIPQK